MSDKDCCHDHCCKCCRSQYDGNPYGDSPGTPHDPFVWFKLIGIVAAIVAVGLFYPWLVSIYGDWYTWPIFK